MSFEKYVQVNIFLPAGMKYSIVGGGAGGGESTITDLYLLSTALQNNQLLNSSTTQLLFSYTIDGTWGLGSIHQKIGSEIVVGHGGDYERVCSDFAMYLKSGYTVIVLSNTDPPFAHFVADKVKELLIRQ